MIVLPIYSTVGPLQGIPRFQPRIDRSYHSILPSALRLWMPKLGHYGHFSATVLVCMPTVCRLAEYLIEQNEPSNSVRLILYIGELLHNGQKKLLRKGFPSARIGPIQYGSVDGGLIGFPDSLTTDNDDNATIYAVNTQDVIMELVTDDGEPITEEGVRGNKVITNLVRRLMPIIRYPMDGL